MSIEMPEAVILARQMQAELPGKPVTGFELRGCTENLREWVLVIGIRSVCAVCRRTVESVVSRGNTISPKLCG
jgi:hypothetical protein